MFGIIGYYRCLEVFWGLLWKWQSGLKANAFGVVSDMLAEMVEWFWSQKE